MAASSNNTEYHHGHDVGPSFSIAARAKVLILPFSQGTALSLFKSRLALGSPCWPVVRVFVNMPKMA